jgi:hypothetical protein
MFEGKKVFDILLLISDKLGLHSKFWTSFDKFKKFAQFTTFNLIFWLLMVTKVIFFREKIDNYKLLIFIAVSFNVVRLIYFIRAKDEIVKLQSELIKSFEGETSEKYLEAAERKIRKGSGFLILFLTPTIAVAFVTCAFADEPIIPLFLPEFLNYTGIVRISYVLLQMGCTWYCYILVWIFNLTVINFLIHFQELSKFVGSKFEVMKTNDDLKKCVDINLNFIRSIHIGFSFSQTKFD